METPDNLHSRSQASPEYGFTIRYRWGAADSSASLNLGSAIPSDESIMMLSAPKNYPGYINGFCQPVALIELKLRTIGNAALARFQQVIKDYFPTYVDGTFLTHLDVVQCFGELICHLQKMAGFPIFTKAEIAASESEQRRYSVWVPTLFGVWLPFISDLILKIFNKHFAEDTVRDNELVQQLNNMVNFLKTHAPQGTNSLHFLTAANTMQISWQHIAANVFQYGQGKHACWLNSTFTDATSQIGANLAANKITAHHLLQKAGFPIVKHYIVHKEVEALACAQQIGFPIVIKPIDGKGGNGVFANLLSVESVRKAWRQVSKITQTIMVEKHIPGKDYRLLVFQGQVIWAIERIPAGVTGNSVDSIHQLVVQHNLKHQAIYPLRNILVTDDTKDYLHEQGLSVDTILEKDYFVPLNRIANISAGGTPVAVLDQVHPDNIRLMEAAAQLMRLDIAGIDFISPDIRQSWRDNQGVILEINAQPQLGKTTGPHLYMQILKQLIYGQGRIPIIVLCGSPAKTQLFAQNIRQMLAPHFDSIGVASCEGAEVNGEKIVGPLALYTSGIQLLLRKDIEALIYCVTTEEEVTLHGLAFDRYTNLFLLDDIFLKWQKLAMDTLLKACFEKVYISETTSVTKLNTQREILILSKDPAEVLQTWLIELQKTCR